MDKTVMGDLDSLPEDDKIRMSAIIDRIQNRDRSATTPLSPRYTILWWRDVLPTASTLGKHEERCVIHCAQKFLKVSALVRIRLASE
ncbi:hypothetical protein SAY87_023440 [Trapa incisa]|uniref:Mitochondrial import inner membrane translocase subunit n=1 Tax=Trapa incisa TaxID=236973 RepID=A0AAN7L0L3_9MYRT|nr:hypothetical protein SAY87_023440 [Trapa incisa]